MPRAQSKTATLTLRIDPQVKDLLTAAADADRRSMSNMLEVIVLWYSEQHSIAADSRQLPAKPSAKVKKKRVPA